MVATMVLKGGRNNMRCSLQCHEHLKQIRIYSWSTRETRGKAATRVSDRPRPRPQRLRLRREISTSLHSRSFPRCLLQSLSSLSGSYDAFYTTVKNRDWSSSFLRRIYTLPDLRHRQQHQHHRPRHQQQLHIRNFSTYSPYSTSSETEICVDPSSSKNGHPVDIKSWKQRVEWFLTKIDQETETTNTTKDEEQILEELQVLLDEMLQNTLSGYMTRRQRKHSSEASSAGGHFYDDNEEESQDSSAETTASWNILNAFRSQNPTSTFDDESGGSTSSSRTGSTTTGDDVESSSSFPTSSLAFSLLDQLVKFENSMPDVLLNDHPLSFSDHSNYLNPILDMWRDECVHNSTTTTNFSRMRLVPGDLLPLSPDDVVSKLDRYRKQSNLLVPDTMSYNIVFDAVAGQLPNSRKPNNSTTNSKKNLKKNDDDDDAAGRNAVEFAVDLWRWMMEVSKNDPLIRPDTVTLRSIFKVFISSRRPDAPEQCEVIIQEWMDWQAEESSQSDISSSSSSSKIYCTLLESLVHVWANYNPEVAERYIHEITSRFLTITSDTPLSECSDPPNTVTWNRLISSCALTHDDPVMAQQILEDFWEFYRRVHSDDETTLHHPYAWKVGRPDLWSYASILEGFARQKNPIEANKVFARLVQVKTTSPNIQCYTSAMKANEDDLPTVRSFAQQCLDTYHRQQQDPEISDKDKLAIDCAFFEIWLKACAKARQIEEGKKIMSKHMKSIPTIQPRTSTYLSFLEVLLSNDDSQGAIEWLLAYAKLEKMNEPAIVAWTIALIDWYNAKKSNRASDDFMNENENVDLNIMLQILVENRFISSSVSFERLLMKLSSTAALELLNCIKEHNKGENDGLPTLRVYAIVMNKLANEENDPEVVEKLFDECWYEMNENHKVEDNDSDRSELYTSLLVAWGKQGNIDLVMYWMDRMAGDYDADIPPLSLKAQTAVISALCSVGRISEAEKIVLSMKDASADKKEGSGIVPPDTALYNMVLRGWMGQRNGDRAMSFFEQAISNPNAISYNSVVNALCMDGQLDAAEDLAARLVEAYHSSSDLSLRPDDYTFTPILAGWRRVGEQPGAAKRCENILQKMVELHRQGVILRGPDVKSFQVVLDTWDKSPDPNAAKSAHKLLATAPKNIRHSGKLWARLKRLQNNPQHRRHRKNSVTEGGGGE